MNPKYKAYEKRIPRQHRFGWTPTYSEEIKTSLRTEIITEVMGRTMEEIGWEES